MSFISVRTITPNVGKSALAAERVRMLGDIYARNGARVRLARVVSGDGAGELFLGTANDDGKSMAQVFEKVQADPAYAKLLQAHEQSPAGTVTRREVYRTVHGQLQPGCPVILMREYAMSRDKLAGLLALMPELDALLKGHDITVMAASPVFSSDMSRLVATYYFRSVAQLGAAMDGVGQSPEFMSIVTKAAAFGSLARSRVLVTM